MRDCKCANFFGQKLHLIDHIKTVHENQRDYNCQICGRSFRLKLNLNRHVKTVHEKQRDWKCDI